MPGEDTGTTVSELRGLVAAFVAERAWEKFHDPKNLSMALAVEAAELMQEFQWSRSEELEKLLEDPERRQAVLDELADVACFVLALCNTLDADLSEIVRKKMEKNRRKYPADEYQGWYERPSEDRADG